MKKKKSTQLDKGLIARTLDWAYGKALTGFVGVDSAYVLANSYQKQKVTLDEQVNSLIRWQVTKAAASGFTLGLGGIMTMPLTVPANVASIIYMQIRMISAIAIMGGHDVQSDKVRTLVYVSMVGNGAKELLKDISIHAGEKLVLKVSERIAVKLGEQGVTGFGKIVPILGGVVGGSYDAITTRIVGKVAKKIFIDNISDIPPLYREETIGDGSCDNI